MTTSVARGSKLIRLGLWLLIACAAWAAIGLVAEFYRFTQSMPDPSWNFRVARLVGLVCLNLVFTALLAIIVVLALWVRMAGALPDLQGWHLQFPASEFCASRRRCPLHSEQLFGTRTASIRRAGCTELRPLGTADRWGILSIYPRLSLESSDDC